MYLSYLNLWEFILRIFKSLRHSLSLLNLNITQNTIVTLVGRHVMIQLFQNRWYPLPLVQGLNLSSSPASSDSLLLLLRLSTLLHSFMAPNCLTAPAYCLMFVYLSVLPTLLYVSLVCISQSHCQRNCIWIIVSHSSI